MAPVRQPSADDSPTSGSPPTCAAQYLWSDTGCLGTAQRALAALRRTVGDLVFLGDEQGTSTGDHIVTRS
jgi:hypothetical protein